MSRPGSRDGRVAPLANALSTRSLADKQAQADAELEAAAKKYDSNGDGRFDLAEVKQMLKDMKNSKKIEYNMKDKIDRYATNPTTTLPMMGISYTR